MEKINLQDGKNLVSFSNSILKKYNIKTFHESFKLADEILANTDKKICVILLDGFGKNILNIHKNEAKFLHQNLKDYFYSVYPTTTVAATTAFLTGKYPIETGYIGWTQYFKTHNKFIDVFRDADHFTNEKVNPLICDDVLRVDKIMDLINKNTNKKADSIYSFNYETGNHTYVIEDFFNDLDKMLKVNDFVYAYSIEPDSHMHSNGTKHESVAKIIKSLDENIEKIAKNNQDVLFFVIADHGMVDSTLLRILQDEKFANLTSDNFFSIEGRFASLNIIDEPNFIKYYEENLKDDFILLNKEELLKENLLGFGQEHELFQSFLGNYFLLAKSNCTLMDDRPFSPIGNHAGVTEEEHVIPFIVINGEK